VFHVEQRLFYSCPSEGSAGSGEDAVNRQEVSEAIYMDNAATSWPKPAQVAEAVGEYFYLGGGSPHRGFHGRARGAERIIRRGRGLVARLLGVEDSSRIVFTSNATTALNIALKGILAPGDHVISSGMEHNAVALPLARLEGGGVQWTRLSHNSQGGIAPAQLLGAIQPNTRLIAMVHASNVNGALMPVREIGDIARRCGIPFLLDAAQTIGSHPIDIDELSVSVLAFPGHKGLFGPPGTGGLYLRPGLTLATIIEGGTGESSPEASQAGRVPEGLEAGTPNTPGIAGLGAGVSYVLQEGAGAIGERIAGHVDRLMLGLSEIRGVRLQTPLAASERAGVVSFSIEGMEPGVTAGLLEHTFDIQVRAGLHCAPLAHKQLGTFPGGTVRLSPGYFTTSQEVERVLQAVENLAAIRPR